MVGAYKGGEESDGERKSDKGTTDLVAPITYAGAVELEFVVGRMLKALFAVPVSAQKGKKSGVSLSASSPSSSSRSSRVMMWKREGGEAEAAPKLLPSSLNPNVTHFAVHSLPNVGFNLPPSWAGQISIPGVADDQLFFWLFQAEDRNASENLISKTKSRWFAGKSLTSIQFG